MLKEVLTFKRNIEKCNKYWEEQPKMYVLCTTLDTEHSRYSYTSNRGYIRPCNVSFNDYVKACKHCTDINMTLAGAICDVDFNEVDKNQFLLECAMLGIMPSVEFIDDSEYNPVDEIDLTTGISYVAVRRACLEKKKAKTKKKKIAI